MSFLKRLFRSPVDLSTELDRVQAAFAAYDLALSRARLPEDPECWTDEHCAIYEELESHIPNYDYENPPCICTGTVKKIESTCTHIHLELELDPPPKHSNLPKVVCINWFKGKNTLDDFYALRKLQKGKRASVRGVFLRPHSFWEKGDYNTTFALTETKRYRDWKAWRRDSF